MFNMNRKIRKGTNATRQSGAVLPIFVVGMLSILLMAGLALDVSHMLLNKSRLQNAVDSAALAGAEVLHQGTGLITDAEDAALRVFRENQNGAGNFEMLADIDWTTEVIVEFSEDLEPFSAGAGQGDADYVRVTVEDFTMTAWFLGLINIDEKQVRASAVAGASPTLGAVCDLIPLIVCGEPDPAAGGGAANNWGFTPGDVTVLKSGSQNGSKTGPIGPGNFQLAELGGSGCNTVRENLAGGFEDCVIGDTVPTKPGNCVGPVTTGLNTRFGESKYSDKLGVVPDVIVQAQDQEMGLNLNDKDDPYDDDILLDKNDDTSVVNSASDVDFNYTNYQSRLGGPYDNDPAPIGNGEFNRRNVSVIIADCTGEDTNGASDLPILSFGCYFLLQPVTKDGKNGIDNVIFGQFLETCEASGVVGPDPEEIPGPFKIQLYKDSGSVDS